MTKQTLTFESPSGHTVKWDLMASQQLQRSLLAYRVIGLVGTLGDDALTGILKQALEQAGFEGKYEVTYVPQMQEHNEYGHPTAAGWRVKQEGHDEVHELGLFLTFPIGWNVSVDGAVGFHGAGHWVEDFYAAFTLTVVSETNGSKLPPPVDAFTPPEHFPHDSEGKPVILPVDPPAQGDRLLSQEEAEARRLAQAKADAEDMGFTVDPE